MTAQKLPSLIRCLALALVGTSAFAGGWATVGIHGGFHGGYHGGHGWVGRGRFGGTIRVLPRGYATYRWGGNPYFFYGGYWYRPWRGAYLGCYPPVGLFLDVLPLGYATSLYSGVRYYDYDDIYYTDGPTGGYVVAQPPLDRVPPPPGAVPPPPPGAASPAPPAADALIITPKEGQSTDRMKADRAEAQRFAIRKSGFDPAYANPSDPGTPRARRAYLRAMKHYLEARGYAVE